MTNKKLNLLFASVFAVVFLIGLASATITLTPSVSTLTQTSGSFNLTVLSDQNETVNLAITSITDSSGNTIIFSLSPTQVILNTATPSKVVSVTYNVQSGFNFDFLKTYNAVIDASGSLTGATSKTVPFASSGFCEVDNKGDLVTTVENVDVIGANSFGSNNEWYALDTVQIDVQVRDRGSEDINSVSLEWGLYDVQSKTWAIDVNEEDNFDLSSDDEQTTTITFTLDDSMDINVKDLQKGDYIFYVRATGDISGGTYDGDSTCNSDSSTGKLTVDKNFVILNDLQVPSTVQCGADLQLSGTAWNIGSSNQKSVYVEAYSKDLGINNVQIDVGDVDSFDSSDFDKLFTIPQDLQEKNYTITLTVYDKNDKVYANGNKDKAVFTVPVKVQGNCAIAKASVVAVLDSGGEAGKPMVVKATITNTGNKVATYDLSASDYSNWATSASFDKTSITLNAGDSTDVLITFNTDKAALGTNIFTLDILSQNQQILAQPIQVEVTKSSGFLSNLFTGDNKLVLALALLSLVLVILIIVVAVKISKK